MRSMRSYEVGGVTGLPAMGESSAESDCTYVMEGYPPRKVKKCKGNKMSTRRYNRSRRVPGIRG